MNNNLDKDLQEAINEESSSQELSSNFTFKVMDKVEQIDLKREIKKSPLVNWVSGLIFTLFGILITLILLLGERGGSIAINIDFTTLQDRSFVKTFMLVLIIVLVVGIFVFADTLLRKRNKGI